MSLMSPDATLEGWASPVVRAEAGLNGRVAAGISAIPALSWRTARPSECEGWGYLSACEAMPPPAMTLAAASISDGAGFVAGAPLFALNYRLDTPLQGGPLARLADGLTRRLPRLMEWRMLGVGSPFTEECPVALAPRLDEAGRAAALDALLQTVEAEAARRGAGLIAFKDLAPAEAERLAPQLAAAGYVAVESLPVAVLDLGDSRDLEAYLAQLSAATRKDLRRKLKGSAHVKVEWRHSIVGMEREIRALYEATRAQSTVHYGDFEELPDDYFEQVSRALGPDAVFVCYRIGDRLTAFNLLLVGPDRVVDKFLGMSYPEAREHNLYAVSWLENVRFCQRIGRRLLQTGQTAYASKLRFGSLLEPRLHYVKHRNRLIQAGVRAAAPLLSFPRWDPELRRHRGADA